MNTDSHIKPIFDEKLLLIQEYHGKKESELQKNIDKAKSEPVLVRICQLLESMLVDFNQKLGEKDVRITEFGKKVSIFEKSNSIDTTVVQNELDDPKERMLSTEMYNPNDTTIVNNPLECQNRDLLGKILSFCNSNLQS